MPGYMNNDGSELVGGKLPTGTGQALPLDAQGSLVVSQAIMNAADNGQQFIAAVNFATTDVTNNLSLVHILNNGTAKTARIISLRVWYNTAGVHPIVQIAQTSGADANATVAVTAANKKPGATASLMTMKSNKGPGVSGPAAPAGTIVDTIDLSANNAIQLLQNGAVYELPAGAVNGLEVAINAPNGESGITIEWIEF